MNENICIRFGPDPGLVVLFLPAFSFFFLSFGSLTISLTFVLTKEIDFKIALVVNFKKTG